MIFGNRIFCGNTRRTGTVCDVDIQRFLGTWYEIARMPSSFENGLDHVTATYSMKNNTILVVNSGIRNGEKVTISGKATIPDPGCPGSLLVSFFPFAKSQYRIIALDKENYGYALVTSKRRNYLWLLSRTPKLEERIAMEMISKARLLGFKVKNLQWVKQD